MGPITAKVAGGLAGPLTPEIARELARTGVITLDTPVNYGDGEWVPAGQGPVIFSDKSWATAAIISFLFGCLGVDRIYVGHYGLGVTKLLLGWATLFIWPLIDLFLFVTRKVADQDGRPLR